MAKYEINYCCGHGSVTKQLYGPNKERERKIEWMEDNMLCPECFKKSKAEADAAAPKKASIALVPGLGVTLQASATGQIEANKAALYEHGFRWTDAASGMMGYLSMSRPERVLAVEHKCADREAAKAWVRIISEVLSGLGYEIDNRLGPLDEIWMQEEFAKLDEQAAAIAADPRPEESPLYAKIRVLQNKTGSKWNGKIYGRKGSWNYYVNNVNYSATDEEVAELQKNITLLREWQERHPEV